MCSTPIIPEPPPDDNPAPRAYRLSARLVPAGPDLLVATGVLVRPDGQAVLGQPRADLDDGTYTVAPFLAADGSYLPAPPDWRAHLLPDPPPPAASAACAIPVLTTA